MALPPTLKPIHVDWATTHQRYSQTVTTYTKTASTPSIRCTRRRGNERPQGSGHLVFWATSLSLYRSNRILLTPDLCCSPCVYCARAHTIVHMACSKVIRHTHSTLYHSQFPHLSAAGLPEPLFRLDMFNTQRLHVTESWYIRNARPGAGSTTSFHLHNRGKTSSLIHSGANYKLEVYK